MCSVWMVYDYPENIETMNGYRYNGNISQKAFPEAYF